MPLSEVLRILDEPVTKIVRMFNNALKAAQGAMFSPTGNDYWTDTPGVRHGGDWGAPHAGIHFAPCGPRACQVYMRRIGLTCRVPPVPSSSAHTGHPAPSAQAIQGGTFLAIYKRVEPRSR